MDSYNPNKIDIKTWEDFINGDKNAFSLIYKRSIDDLYSFGMSKMPDPDIVEDAIQDAFIALYEKRHMLKVSGNLEAYLLKTFRNKIIERIRIEKRKENIIGETPNSKNELIDNVEDNIIDSERSLNRIRLIEKCMDSLTPRQKEAIYLKYTSNYSYEQISEILNIDVASSRTLVYRGLKRIKKMLTQSVYIFFQFFFKS